MTDLYKLLGVAPSAEPEVIRAAYRTLMLKYHPDTSTAPDAADRARLINEAYSVLKDPAKRAAYDSALAARRAPPPSQRPANGSKPAAKSSSMPIATPAIQTWHRKVRTFGQSISLPSLRTPGLETLILAFLLIIGLGIWSVLPAGALKETGGVPSGASSTMFTNNDRTAEPLAKLSPPIPKVERLTPPSAKDLEIAAREATRVWSEDGMLGAEAYSRRCHQEPPSDLARIDHCVMFDRTIYLLDQAVAPLLGSFPNAYFEQSQTDVSLRYQAAGTSPIASLERVEQIQYLSEPIVVSALDEIATHSDHTSPQ